MIFHGRDHILVTFTKKPISSIEYRNVTVLHVIEYYDNKGIISKINHSTSHFDVVIFAQDQENG